MKFSIEDLFNQPGLETSFEHAKLSRAVVKSRRQIHWKTVLTVIPVLNKRLAGLRMSLLGATAYEQPDVTVDA